MRNIFFVAWALCMALTGCQLQNSEMFLSPRSMLEDSSAGDAAKSPAASTPAGDTDVRGTGRDSARQPRTVTVTVPEGYTLARIGMTLEEQGFFTAGEFIGAAQTGDYGNFPLIAAQDAGKNRCFKLEGYLFPDTYEFYSDASPDTVITTLLSHTEKMIDPELRKQIADSGYTTDEIITLASIIEKEAQGPREMGAISSVLHNRLNSGMRLQCDVTIHYVENAIKPFITGNIDRYNSDYNTYKCDRLPAGAICNPSIDAIKAALNPSDTTYLFFVTDSNGVYYYAETWEEHLENVSIAMPDANPRSS